MHFLLERYLLKKLFKGELCDLTSNLMLPLMLQHVSSLVRSGHFHCFVGLIPETVIF